MKAEQKAFHSSFILSQKRLFFAALLAPVVLLLVLVSVAEYRHRTFEVRWAKVQFGMSKDEVRQLLGEPDQSYSPGSVQSDSLIASFIGNWLLDTSYERWAYGERRLFAFGPTFPYVNLAWDGLIFPENQDHVVYFTSEGKVLKKKYPYRAGEPTR
jgi:hypothetical protein